VTEAATWALQQVNEDSNVLPALGAVAELLPTVATVLRRHEQERLPYSSEELITSRRVIEGVRGYYASIRDAERARALAEEQARRAALEEAEAERRAIIEAARAQIPSEAYGISLTDIGLSSRVLGHLQRSEVATVGDVMERLAEGDEGLLRLDGFGPRSLAEVKQRIEALNLPKAQVDLIPPEEEAAAEEEAVEEAPAPEVVAEMAEVAAPLPAEAALEAPEVVVEKEAPSAEAEMEITAPPEPVSPATIAAVEGEAVAEEQIAATVVAEPEVAEGVESAPSEQPESFIVVEEAPDLIFEGDEMEIDKAEERRRGRSLRRHLVYDEEAGQVVARRRHKRGEVSDDWEDVDLLDE
jgi:hypothetical protein